MIMARIAVRSSFRQGRILLKVELALRRSISFQLLDALKIFGPQTAHVASALSALAQPLDLVGMKLGAGEAAEPVEDGEIEIRHPHIEGGKLLVVADCVFVGMARRAAIKALGVNGKRSKRGQGQ